MPSVKSYQLFNIENASLPIAFLVLTAALAFRLTLIHFASDESTYWADEYYDGRTYARIATNLLDHHVYTSTIGPPYDPDFARVPGYPLILAAIYSVFGRGNNTVVRVAKAGIDTTTCGLVALLAFYWEPKRRKKRSAALAALALAAFCPFTAIHAATMMSETLATFFGVVLFVCATLAFKTSQPRSSSLWWIAAGLVGGAAVLVRPDMGLFVLAVGVALILVTMFQRSGRDRNDKAPNLRTRTTGLLLKGGFFALAFALALAPWSIRNWRRFHVFQPINPFYAGESIPPGYVLWLRTWIDDPRYLGQVWYGVGNGKPIAIGDLPACAFDSAEERQRIAELFDSYNYRDTETARKWRPESQQGATDSKREVESSISEESRTGTGVSATNQPSQNPTPEPGAAPAEDSTTGKSGGEGDAGDNSDDSADDDTEESDDDSQSLEDQPWELSPQIDAAFAQIARERIARNRLRYYCWLPTKRVVALWFDTHSDYWPFAGHLFPLNELDYNHHQQILLPLFASFTWIYTLLAVAGAWTLWKAPDRGRRWLLLISLGVFLRFALLSTFPNGLPRYVVELFPLVAVLGGLAAPYGGLYRISSRFRRSSSFG